MLNRRLVLMGLGAAFAPASAQSLPGPRLFILSAGAISQPLDYNHNYIRKSVEGWLVCNGAEADREVYSELFAQLGTRAGPGNGKTTFNLPTFPLELKDGEPSRGTAICPSWRFGSPPGSTMPFTAEPSS